MRTTSPASGQGEPGGSEAGWETSDLSQALAA